MGNIFKKIQNRRIFQAIIFIVIIVVFLFNIKFVMAAADFIDYGTNYPLGVVGGAVSIVLSIIAYILTAVIGLLITVVVAILIQVAQYGNIINVPTVIEGWVVIRDLCNMFFILILLVIAFATILRIESYNYKKILPKLLIMAVLINFSRTIFGLLIDFSQVIMLTFVNAFSAGGGWFIDAFRTNMLLTISNKTPGGGDFAASSWSTTLAIIAGVMAAIITLIIVVVMLAVLVMRIIMLWIYTIFSPLVFMGFAVPALQKYTGKIWEDFIKQLVVGPVLAFFIWLALTTASKSSDFLSGQQLTSGDAVCVGAGAFFCTGNFQNFIIVIGLLVGGLMVAQQMGGAAGAIAGKGLAFAKGAGKYVGGALGYIPAQFAKKAGYELGDKALGQLSKVPIIGNLAMEGKGRLRMHRDYAEEKETKYMQYLDEKDYDKILERQRSKGIISFLGKGMESKRQLFRKASVEKDKRGDEWGQTKEAKMANKTRSLIELFQMAGHSITSSGEDAFRNAELGKLAVEFRNRNAGMIDDVQMRDYYFGNEGNAIGPHGERTGEHYKYKKLDGDPANSEYYRIGGWKDPNTGYWYEEEEKDPITGMGTGKGKNFVSPDSMLAYTVMRQRMNEFFSLHHENYGAWEDTDGKEHYDVLEAGYDEGNGPMKTFAQIRDRGTRQQKLALRSWMKYRLKKESDDKFKGSKKFINAFNALFNADGKQEMTDEKMDEFTSLAMRNRGLGDSKGGGKAEDVFGASRPIIGKTNSAEVASGITGSDRAGRGVMAANFSELGLEKVAGKTFQGADKTEIAARIKNSLQNNGMAEAAAQAIEDQINKASYLILHNKEAGVSLSEVKTTQAHELMHARLGANFSQDELKGVWNSMDENDRTSARQQISSKWGGNMSEEAIMNEYFAEGLMAKTRWGGGAVASLSQSAEKGLDGLLKSKGSNITAFTSNVHKIRPNSDDIKQSMASNIDGSLKDTLDELIYTLRDVGNGFSSIESFADNISGLQRSMDRNRTGLESSVKSYKNVTEKLNNLSSKIS